MTKNGKAKNGKWTITKIYKKNTVKLDTEVKLNKIFKEVDLDGDIGFDESESDFYKRKFIELYEHFKELLNEHTTFEAHKKEGI